MSKEEMREREREMKKRLMKETRELDREIFKVESMKKQAEDKLKKEIAKGTVVFMQAPRRITSAKRPTPVRCCSVRRTWSGTASTRPR